MKELTKWLWAWAIILLVILGFPTLGFTWCLIYAWDFRDPWQIKVVTAAELWLHRMRQTALIIAGFPTLGYTWLLVNRFEEPLFLGPRLKYENMRRRREEAVPTIKQ
jgi:hypothetical protein